MNHEITGRTISLTGVQEHSVLGWESGEYSFESKAFFPIDTEYPNEAPDFYNQTYTAETVVGHGNQGREQNYHFCSKIHTVHHILPYIVHHVVHHVVRHIVDYMHMHMTCTSSIYPCCVHSRHHHAASQQAFAYYGFGEFVFTGDDDVWVFINNRLAVTPRPCP